MGTEPDGVRGYRRHFVDGNSWPPVSSTERRGAPIPAVMAGLVPAIQAFACPMRALAGARAPADARPRSRSARRESCRQLGDARALVPQAPRSGVVLRRLAEPGRAAIGVIGAGDISHIGRGGEIDDGLRALLRRDREQLGDADAEAEQAAVVVAEAGGDE